jgi:hypothetical protein
MIGGKVETGCSHLESLINVGELVEAVMIAGVTISEQHYTHVGALFIVEDADTTKPFEGCGVAG